MQTGVIMKPFFKFFSLFFLFFCVTSTHSFVGTVIPGQPLWGITKRIGETVDVIESKVCEIDTDLSLTSEILCSKLEDIESTVDAIMACAPTVLSSSDVVVGVITLNASGNYCLSEDVTANITISADFVTLDLNHRCLTGGISISSDDVDIKNGTVEASVDGIIANSGNTNITIEDVTVKNAIRGINFANVTGGTITNCEMTLNTTGLELDNSHKINVMDCVANCNTHAGYCLISSTTCCLLNSKALSTGEGNIDIDTTSVLGFVSRDGSANIFERCIANSTQALSVTGSSSVIAGFAFRGTEKCSKIIDSEASNSTTNPDGFTVPYGILLEGTIDSTQSVSGVDLGGGVSSVFDVAWSADGLYVAIGGTTITGGTGDEFQIFRFDRAAGTLTSITGALAGSINAVDWSSDGQYVAVGGSSITGGTGDQFQIFRFDRAAGILTSITGALSGFARSVDWSADGQYVAVGGSSITGGTGDQFQIFRFDRAAQTVTSIAGALAGFVFGVDWSFDGQYVAIGGTTITGGTGDEFQIFRFDRAAGTLTSITGALAGTIRSVDWSADGQFIAVGGIVVGGTGDIFQLFTGLQFPEKNVIKNNTVYCNSGNQFPGGVGISGSSIANMIIGNTSYSNPIPRGENAPIISSNYEFVTNVFNPLFSQAPSDIQNISLDGCDPICTPEDIALLIKQTLFKVCTPIPSQLDVIESAIEALNPCAPTAVTTAGTISTSGTYCLANEISGSITIAASDVDVDLNNYRVTQGITVNGDLDQVKIRNGVVEGTSDAILVNGGSTNITIEDVVVKNAIRGINFENVTGGTITNCEMTLNTTGLELDNSHKVNVMDCVANCNTHAGYCLISSTTCCLVNSKALSTGEGNVDIDTTSVLGFVSRDGSANIFERCIANSTQALSVTGSSSVIAGFAFRGTEKCSKIIDSEASNSTTNPDGFTVPYGIFFEGTLDSTQSVSGVDVLGAIRSVPWSPDGLYVAVGGNSITGGTGDQFQIFRFDRAAGTLTSITGALSGGVFGVAWSPDGLYVAIGGTSITSGTGQFQIFRFDRAAGTLTSITGALSGIVSAVAWSPDGLYVAIVGTTITGGSGGDFQIFRFDRAAGTLTSITGALGEVILDVAWSPDGLYVAIVGSTVTGGTGDEFQIFRFDRAIGALTSITGALSGTIRSVAWSPDGLYVAIGGQTITGGTGDEFQIFRFDRAAGILTSITGALSGDIGSVDWSPDGQFIAIGGDTITGGTGEEFQIFRFDRAAGTLTSITGALGGSDDIFGVAWSPDGQFIAIGGDDIIGGTGDEFQLFTGFQFPEKNVIKNNTVYCNSGNQFPGGVGISGSSIANMIIGNTSYSNPIPRGENAPIVSSNYQFVTNVFNPLFGLAPSDIQNISLDGCAPICQPDDISLLVKQNQVKICNIESVVDFNTLLLESLIDNLL